MLAVCLGIDRKCGFYFSSKANRFWVETVVIRKWRKTCSLPVWVCYVMNKRKPLQVGQIVVKLPKLIFVGNCSIRYLFLIWLTFLSDFVYLHNQSNMYAARCFIAPYIALFRVITAYILYIYIYIYIYMGAVSRPDLNHSNKDSNWLIDLRALW